jgi:hypothetical protein
MGVRSWKCVQLKLNEAADVEANRRRCAESEHGGPDLDRQLRAGFPFHTTRFSDRSDTAGGSLHASLGPPEGQGTFLCSLSNRKISQTYNLFGCRQASHQVNGARLSISGHSLAALSETFEGFDNDVGRMVLGDLLLSFLLQNRKGSSNHGEQIIRVFPAHYFASWIDLPHNIAHLRGVLYPPLWWAQSHMLAPLELRVAGQHPQMTFRRICQK